MHTTVSGHVQLAKVWSQFCIFGYLVLGGWQTTGNNYIYIEYKHLVLLLIQRKKSLRVDKHVDKCESHLHPHGTKCVDEHHTRIFLDHI